MVSQRKDDESIKDTFNQNESLHRSHANTSYLWELKSLQKYIKNKKYISEL